MAGIKQALKRVMERKNEGTVVGKGRLKTCQCDSKKHPLAKCPHGNENAAYIIVRLKHDNGMITQYEGTDIRISDSIQVGDKVLLMIMDNWSAKWICRDAISKIPDDRPQGAKRVCIIVEPVEIGGYLAYFETRKGTNDKYCMPTESDAVRKLVNSVDIRFAPVDPGFWARGKAKVQGIPAACTGKPEHDCTTEEPQTHPD